MPRTRDLLSGRGGCPAAGAGPLGAAPREGRRDVARMDGAGCARCLRWAWSNQGRAAALGGGPGPCARGAGRGGAARPRRRAPADRAEPGADALLRGRAGGARGPVEPTAARAPDEDGHACLPPGGRGARHGRRDGSARRSRPSRRCRDGPGRWGERAGGLAAWRSPTAQPWEALTGNGEPAGTRAFRQTRGRTRARPNHGSDVTREDIRRAGREGPRPVEHVHRRTTPGTATKQGRDAGDPSGRIHADAFWKPWPSCATA